MPARNEIPLLIGQSGPVVGQRWTLAAEQVTIGRDATCDVIIADRQVSRVHARLSRGPDGFEVEDLASKNGTHVNGQPLQSPQLLRDGDLIQIALVAKLVYVGSEATLPLSASQFPAAQAAQPGRLRLDSAARRVWVGEREVDPPLSAPQFRFLEMLCENPGQVCTRERVIQVVWPEAEAGEGISEQAIDALVRRLRDRLAEVDPSHQYVATVRGHGFRLDNPPV